ncbi:IQ domain-containing protein G-like [Spodoptera litura]|uniref:Dynein regulatory complex protein 9 n=1 Tax=Spodoptera litura TaxID=69820 RepID=A0A9J7DV72_SPOLT|nr:IQ domain-containing protein G-like [Spodoptera litura]
MESPIPARQHRIQSVVSETWGRGTVYDCDYDYDYDEETLDSKRSLVKGSRSKLSQKMSGLSELEICSEDSETVLKNRLPFLLSAFFATIFEDVLAQVWILENCNNGLKIQKMMADMDYLTAIKYNVRRNEVNDELDGVNAQNLNSVVFKIKKLDTDRKFLNNVMTATYLSLAQTHSFEPLSKCINSILELDEYRLQIAEEENKNKLIRKELSKQLRQQHNHIRTVLYDTDVTIDKLRTQVEDSVLYSEVRGRYIDNWQRARTEQHNQSIYDTEHKPASVIEYYKKRSDHEIRIHTEVDTLVSIAINEILQRIEEWMDKYDKDMEAIDLNIQRKKNDYQDTRERRKRLEETFEKHISQMKLWNDFKEEREKIRAYRAKMTKSAIIVQAWWRGLLVRLELGPFRPRKPKHVAKKKYEY